MLDFVAFDGEEGYEAVSKFRLKIHKLMFCIEGHGMNIMFFTQ
jgi:hypothetical protein